MFLVDKIEYGCYDYNFIYLEDNFSKFDNKKLTKPNTAIHLSDQLNCIPAENFP